jgi:transposase
MAELSHCGIDVSKDRLDVVVLPDEQCFSVINATAGWAELIEKLRGLNITAIGIEASGGYERGNVRALLAARFSVRLINPFKLRQFAKACGVLAKNDRLDARMIARFVATMPTRPMQRNVAAERLAELLTARRVIGCNADQSGDLLAAHLSEFRQQVRDIRKCSITCKAFVM